MSSPAQALEQVILSSVEENSFLVKGVESPLSHFIDFLYVGGPVVWILMLFSVITLTLTLLKVFQFISAKAEAKTDIEASLRAWQEGDIGKAAAVLNMQAPIARIVLTAQQACCEVFSCFVIDQEARLALLRSHREEIARQANSVMQTLRSFLRPLEMIAALSPLLGLLGTVLGMIEAFQQMESAGSQVDPSILSGGIWQALLTTAVGLAVAIPVVILHGYFERKCDRIAFLLDDALIRVFTLKPNFIAELQPDGQTGFSSVA